MLATASYSSVMSIFMDIPYADNFLCKSAHPGKRTWRNTIKELDEMDMQPPPTLFSAPILGEDLIIIRHTCPSPFAACPRFC